MITFSISLVKKKKKTREKENKTTYIQITHFSFNFQKGNSWPKYINLKLTNSIIFL